MHRTARAVVALAAVGALALGAAGPALAAPPGNDLYGGATVVSLGFTETIDTTEATSDADDVALRDACGAPAVEASVWYSLTPTVDQAVVVDVSRSSFPAGVIVATGSPGSFSVVSCGPFAISFPATAGTPYSILAFDFAEGGAGGQLTLEIAELPAAPTLELTVNPVAGFNGRTGIATVSGTVTCTNADFADIIGELEQRVGRGTVYGTFFTFSEGECDGQTHAWTADVLPFNGKFAGGKAASVTFSAACGAYECSFGFDEQTVLLSGKKQA